MAKKSQNTNLTLAKANKKDEFYTQLSDIERELKHYKKHFKDKVVLCNCDDPRVSNFFHFFSYNFEKFGLKKLISTSYAVESKLYKSNYQPTLFEVNDPQFDEYKTRKNGKIFTLTRDLNMEVKRIIKTLSGDI